MIARKCWGVSQNVVGCFANDFKIANHGVLDHFVSQERSFIKTCGVTTDSIDGL